MLGKLRRLIKDVATQKVSKAYSDTEITLTGGEGRCVVLPEVKK